MARAPLQVLVLPFRRRTDGGIEYAIFRRADRMDACWQGLAGGAEEGESAEQAARREMAEEARIPSDAPLIALDATASVPAVHFAASKRWGPDVYVVTERTFGVRVPDRHTITLSDEHSEYRWLPYEAAARLLTWDSNKIALWELNERLRREA
jgi:dATP pyrophosphohydrolase